MTSSIELFQKFVNQSKIFIETGTFSGEGIQCALDAGFEKIYSCDINSEYVERAKEKYKDYDVTVENLESQDFLEKILPTIDERVVIFLDAHSMPHDVYDKSRGFGDDTVKEGVGPCPLEKELNAIKKHPIKDHIIMIDDFHCFNTWMFDGLEFDQINEEVTGINSKYKARLAGNVLCYKVSK
jgi:5S rRNA maturation endonuclease (ribonuclease M5)|tara:strand:+ start:822 stop:1370 length:549 start_codon:yes stop_codon:yes gene_type:complete